MSSPVKPSTRVELSTSHSMQSPMFASLVLSLLGRRTTWRLGRSLYLAAREETANAIQTNGESDLVRMTLAAVRRDDPDRKFIAFDVGANLGEWTQTVLDAVGKSACRIEVFEPVPAAMERIRLSIGADPRVGLNSVAISDRIGTGEMHIVGQTAGTNSLDAPSKGATQTIAVALVTLDEAMVSARLDSVDIVKVDTEGHDIVILRSIAALLDLRKIGVIQFEYNFRWLYNQGSLREVFGLIEGTSYKLGRVLPGRIELYIEWNAELDRYFEANYVLVRDDMVTALSAIEVFWDESNVVAAR